MARINQNLSEIDIPRLRGVVFGEVDYQPSGTFGPRVQRDVQLVMLDQGSVRITTDGRSQVLLPGQVSCQWPGGNELYEFDADGPSRHRWVALSFEASPQVVAWQSGVRHRCAERLEETAAMRSIFDIGFRAVGGRHSHESLLSKALATAYLAAYLEAGGSAVRGQKPLPRPLHEMQQFIMQQFDQSVSLDDLAKAASVTPNHLVRLCRKHLDTTPMRLLWGTRTDMGIDLLKQTGLNISEIAYRVGYANAFHFSRAVKAKTGLPPRDVRKRDWRQR